MGKLKLAKHNEYMFQQVKCSHYMKRVKDGKFINHYPANESLSGRDEWYYEDLRNDKSQVIPDDEIGGSDFVKTYYERVAKDFVGIVVGFELLTVTAELFLDYYQDDYGESYYASKRPREQVECAKVYFGCNRSRYVAMDDIEILK